MARIRHLSKAPITEAVLDFRARLPGSANVETLKAAIAELAGDYPQVEEAWLIEGSFAFASEPAGTVASSSRKANGFFVRSQDGRQVAQFRLDGFTFSRLSPYTSWEEIAPEAFRLWEVYRRATKPDALYRVAVRYINHLRLPQTTREINDILVCAPQVPSELPQIVAGFITRVVVALAMPNTHVNIVQAYNVLPAASMDTILVDLDVVRDEELDFAADSLRPIFEQLREFKNQAFFGSLQETIVGMFE